MPRAFDRRPPDDDHNPLKGLLDYQSIQDTAKVFGGPWKTLMDGFVSLIGGLIPPNLFGSLPLGSIGNFSPNLLANPIFSTAEALLGETQWSWDGATSHTATGGSAKTTATGADKKLLSNPIPVVAGQQLPMSVWTQWSGLTATGNPIALAVTGFLNGVEGATSTLASVASPGASGAWQQLSGTYTAPAGVDEVRMRLVVGNTATAGTVWFDDGAATKNVGTNVVPISFVTGLPDVQASTITLANLANAPKNVPFWVSPNAFEDVAFPRSEIQQEYAVNTPTGSTLPTTGVPHDHTIGATLGNPLITITAGTLALVAVRTTQDRIYNSVGFITNGATPPATVLAGLYQIDPVTGTATLAYDFGNISSQILTGTGLTDTRINTASDIVASAGNLWAVGLLPIGASMTVAAVTKATITTVSGIYPRFATAILTGQASLPATVTDASQADTSRRIWACIGQAVAPDTSPITLIETFNTADTTGWSSASWNQFLNAGGNGNSFGIASGNVYHTVGGTVNYTGFPSALHKTALHTNNQASEITIGSGWNTAAYDLTTTRAYVRARANGTSGVAMHLDNDGTQTRLRIANVTGPNQLGTVRTTVTGLTAAVGDKFRIEAVGTVYTCYRNDVAIPGATWTDSGAVQPTGQSFRTVGWGLGSYRAITFGPIAETARIDYWTGYDK